MSFNETFSEGPIVQYLCDAYHSKFRLQQEDVSVLFCFTCTLCTPLGSFHHIRRK